MGIRYLIVLFKLGKQHQFVLFYLVNIVGNKLQMLLKLLLPITSNVYKINVLLYFSV